MMVLQHPLAKDKIDSVISYSGGTLTALSGWASGKAASSVVNTKVNDCFKRTISYFKYGNRIY